MESVTYRGTKYYRKYGPDVLRPLNEYELNDLTDSIAMIGVQQPAIVNEKHEVIDGWHRLLICVKLGKEIEIRYKKGLDDETEHRMAIETNLSRRQLSPEEAHAAREKRMLRIAKRRADGESQREIAVGEGVSQSQVRRDLDEISDKEVRRGGADEIPDSGPDYDTDGTGPASAPAPLLCERCQRIGGGGVVGCSRCEDLRREAGQPTRPPPSKAKREPSNGPAPAVYDWPGFDRAYGTVARLGNDLKQLYAGYEDDPEFRAMTQGLERMQREELELIGRIRKWTQGKKVTT